MLDEMMKLQPNHPLSEYVRLKRALSIIYQCSSEELRSSYGDDCHLLPEVEPSKIDVSPALQEYIAQFKREHENIDLKKVKEQEANSEEK